MKSLTKESDMFKSGISDLECAYNNCKYLRCNKCTSQTVKFYLLDCICSSAKVEPCIQVRRYNYYMLYEMSLDSFKNLLKKYDTSEKCPKSLSLLVKEQDVGFRNQYTYEKWNNLFRFFADTIDLENDFYNLIYNSSISNTKKKETIENWGRKVYKIVTGTTLPLNSKVLQSLLNVEEAIRSGVSMGYYSKDDVYTIKKSELYRLYRDNFTGTNSRNLKNVDNFVQSINVSSCSLTKKSIDGIVIVNTCSVLSDSLYIATAKGYMNDIRKLALKSFVDKMKQRKNYVEGLEKFICIKRVTILKTRSIVIAIGLKDGIESLEKVMVNEYLESKGLENV